MHAARRPSRTIALVLLTAYFTNCLLPSVSLAQGTSNVQKGQEYYEQSRFDEAIGLLKDLVDRGALQGDDLQHARELLARSYVKKGYPVQGKEMFKAILRANPQWRPDPIRVPPDETAVFEQALKEYTTEGASAPPPTPAVTTPPPAATTPPPTESVPPAEKPRPEKPRKEKRSEPTPAAAILPGESGGEKKSSKKLWYIVGGVVVLGGIAAAAAGGGGGGGSKSDPVLAGFPGPPTP